MSKSLIECVLSGDLKSIKQFDPTEALRIACICGHEKMVKQLIKAKADVNALDGADETPLHEAAWWGHHRIVRILLNAGALPRESIHGDTPLLLARKHGNFHTAQLLFCE